MVREPSFLFMILLYPVILTVAFGAFFGPSTTGQPTTFSVAVVNLSQASNSTSYSNQFIQDLGATNVLETHSYSGNQTAQSALTQGQVQAVLVIPPTFDASVQSYKSHPSEPGAWVNSTISLYVDRASLESAQVVPSVVQGVLTSAVLGVKPTVVASPIALSSPSLVKVSSESVFDVIVPGLFSFTSIFLIMMVAQSFTSDRESGMLRRIVVTPTTPSELMTSQAVSYLVIGLVQALLVFGSACALGYRPNAGLAGIAFGLMIASIFSVCNVGFGLITASIARTAGTATGISFIFLMPQMFLGTFINQMAPSSSASVAGRFVPAFYVTDALTSLLTRGAALTSPTVLADLGVVIACSVAILLVGIVLFRRFGGL